MKIFNMHNKERTIKEIVKLLRMGNIIAIPTDTCFGLAACAKNREAVKKIFKIKERKKKKPVSLFLAFLRDLSWFTEIERKTYKTIENLLTISGRFTFILKVKKTADFPSPYITHEGKIGVRVPHYELPKKIVRELGTPITATSANRSGKSPIYDYTKIPRELEVEYIIKKRLPKRKPSTVIDLTVQPPKVLREGEVSKKKIKNLIVSKQ